MSRKGRYIVIEGGEGAGKSKHAKLLAGWIRGSGISCINLRDPGGTDLAERIREIFLSTEYEMFADTELFLLQGARSHQFRFIVKPELEKGIYIISARGPLSSDVYQGYAGGVDMGLVDVTNEVSTLGIVPDLTLLIDVPEEIGLARAVHTRMEAKGVEYHQRVRQGYLELAEQISNCIVIPYVEGDVNGMQEQMRKYVALKFRIPCSKK